MNLPYLVRMAFWEQASVPVEEFVACYFHTRASNVRADPCQIVYGLFCLASVPYLDGSS